MVAIQDTELRQGILDGIERAKGQSQSILVSEVHKIDRMNPFYFFASGREKYFGERFFWKDPEGEQFLTGLGICGQIQSVQAADRFFHVEKEWKRFMETALVFNKYNYSGTGPTIFGGFSFDPLKKGTALWSKFSEALFHIPKFMLTIIKGEVYFTTNVICTQHDDISLFEKVTRERQEVLTKAMLTPETAEMDLKEMVEIEPEAWKQTVRDVVNGFGDSNLKKVVLARELRLHFENEVQAERVLGNLLENQKASFIFAFESNGDCFIGASPERLVKKNGDSLFSACLAGSIARGANPEEDEKLGNELLTDQKNLIEHQYVVDMIKEAMEETCDEVILPDQPALMKMKYIQHLYTPVIGKNRKGTSILHLVDRLHPTPALGGLPKQAAIEKIREIEQLDRGLYAAPLGWMDYQGNGEFAVAIRSGLIQGKEASLFAGCGIVADSNAESEYKETSIKFRPMLTALGGKIT
ncbi:isochorismate synthase [Mesobacillus jeotgali]|uniref:isochorismate synthase n=1 Tax=Mesobacillus jeotgali TaxID=129985 RepID=UPI0009A85C8B|nr:isochorismate synthase [Mesobacillus jeotgali]